MNQKCYCIFSAQFLPHVGGVENYTYHMAKELVKKGHEVTIVTSNVEKVQAYEKLQGINVYRLPCYNFVNGRFPVFKLSKEFFEVNKIISKQKYDLIIINTRFYIHSLYGLFFGLLKKNRTIFIEHGTIHLTMHNFLLDILGNSLEHIFTFVEKIFCKEFYGVSEACLEWLEHFHIKGRGTLYNAIDLQEIEMQKKVPICSFRENYGISKESIVITFTGRLVKEKGVLTLIEAFLNINKENEKLYLFIAGDGDEENAVNSVENNNILPLGRITREEIIALLKETDIFCLPSDSEGMPTSVLEAAACRNYIVTTYKGGAKELILDEQYGIIMKSNDEKTVEKALRLAIEQKDSRENAVELTYNRLKDNFTWEKVAQKIVDL